MKIYIDFDDVICETAKEITRVAKRLFGIDLPYREIQFFNLKKAFDLNDDQYELLMQECHTTECLLGYEETPDASRVINQWIDAGHEVFVVTGRPFAAYGPSRLWLDRHGLERAQLYTVDKYGREKVFQPYSYNMTLAQLYSMHFDFAVEDSPAAFEHVLHFEGCRVAVFDRPWNRQEPQPNDRFRRCADWPAIDRMLAECLKEDR